MRERSAAAAAVALASLFGGAAQAQQQLALSERTEARMLISRGAGEAPLPMPILEERLLVTIDGQHATSTLTQVFQNRTGRQAEGRYRLRPGSGSRVEAFAYWNGEEKIVGEVFERQTARRVYDEVTNRRRDPGLLEEDGEGAFSLKVFPIEPDERKRVEVRWSQWLERRGRHLRFRAPLGLPGAEVVVTLPEGATRISSSTHRFHLEKLRAGGLRLRAQGAVANGEELILDWEWRADEPAWTPSVYLHRGRAGEDGWFAVALASPAGVQGTAPKDVTLVIDRSGSMAGTALEHARRAAAGLVARLGERDRVNVVAFSDEVDPLFETPQPADAATRARAIGFIDRMADGGGTDLALALRTAIAAQDPRPDRARVIVFMTDGQSDAGRTTAEAALDRADVRLFTVGLGSGVNRPLLSRLAALKRGRFLYIADAAAIEGEMGRLSATIARPLLVDVALEVQGAQAGRVYPRTLPDVFADDELLVTGRLRGDGPIKVVVRGKLDGKAVAFARTVDPRRAPERPWVGRLWAQARVEHLLEELALGGGQGDELKREVLDLALAYDFVTPYTAFLAIPERELGASAQTVADARAYKQRVLQNHADAAGLDEDDADRDGNLEADHADFENPVSAAGSQAENLTPTSVKRRGGCSGCAAARSTDGVPTALVVLGLLALPFLKRRRRRLTAS